VKVDDEEDESTLSNSVNADKRAVADERRKEWQKLAFELVRTETRECA
jgi:hypothetical protein